MNKNERQFTIREIVTNGNVGSQEELQRSLKRAGFKTTQATLSRDLAEMGVGRITFEEGPRYIFYSDADDRPVSKRPDRARALLSYEVQGIYHNESLVVIKTLTGRAQGVAEMIDSMESQNILGTIAGDNTIFITPKSVKDISKLVRELREFITGNTK
jgi:transcriptional regulator of arginine metabolism